MTRRVRPTAPAAGRRPGLAILLLLLALLARDGRAQPAPGAAAAADPAPPYAVDSLYRVDLSIPDVPAMTVTGTAASALLRPGNTRELAAALANFGGGSSGGSFRLPQAFAVEAAPVLLFHRRLTLAAYRRHQALARLRASLATNRGEGDAGPTLLGIGVRTSLRDDGDPRTNDGYRAAVTGILARATALELLDDQVRACVVTRAFTTERFAFERRVQREVTARLRALPPPPDDAARTRLEDSLSRAIRRELGDRGAGRGCAAAEAQVAAALGVGLEPAAPGVDAAPGAPRTAADSAAARDRLLALIAERRARLGGEIAAARRAFEARAWNARVLDVAAAFGATARDSVGRDPRGHDMGAWLTYGQPAGAAGQLLLGARWRRARDTVARRWDDAGAVGARLLGGTNAYKGFVEGTAGFGAARVSYLGGGTEFRLIESLWATAVVGYELAGRDGRDRLVTRLFLRGAPPAR